MLSSQTPTCLSANDPRGCPEDTALHFPVVPHTAVPLTSEVQNVVAHSGLNMICPFEVILKWVGRWWDFERWYLGEINDVLMGLGKCLQSWIVLKGGLWALFLSGCLFLCFLLCCNTAQGHHQVWLRTLGLSAFRTVSFFINYPVPVLCHSNRRWAKM